MVVFNMEFICPVLGEGDERDFIAIGHAEKLQNCCIY